MRLLSRATRSCQQAKYNLESDIQEPIISISPQQLEELSTRVSALELAAKRALFAERVPKPVFFDTAFNYIDLPMDDLLVRAGKAPLPEPILTQAVKKAEEVVSKVKEAVPDVSNRTTRESTPAATQPGPGEKKGWLGGWFGRN